MTNKSQQLVRSIGKSVSDLIADLSPGDVFDAEQILSEHPELRDDHSAVLDLAYEEFCRRTENGEQVDLSGFVSRFRCVESPLLDLIDVHQVLYENPAVLSNERAPSWPEAGESFLDLQLVESIGRGSFSRVFLASERDVGERRVVAKICANAGHEAALLGKLEHPNIVPILSVKTDRDKQLSAICMPYLGRTTLYHVVEQLQESDPDASNPEVLIDKLFVQEGEEHSTHGNGSAFRSRRPFSELMIDVAIQLCRGLEFAHSRGVIHGDLKPSNILLTKQGTALLMDFNLSQQLCPESQAIGGTLAYMAPEQLKSLCEPAGPSRQPVTCNAQTDVYSLGVLLVELFTGSHPLRTLPPSGKPDESARSLFERQCSTPLMLRKFDSRIDSSLCRVIEKCVAVDPSQRWSSVAELRHALEKTVSLQSRSLRWIRHNKKTVMALSLACCVALTTSIVYAAIPSRMERLMASAEIALNDDRPHDAIHALEQAVQRPETPVEAVPMLSSAYFLSGKQALTAGRYEEAISDLNQSQELDPGSKNKAIPLLRECYVGLGQMASSEGRYEDAIIQLLNAQKLGPESPKTSEELHHCYHSLGQAAFADGDYAVATTELLKAQELDPESAQTRDLLQQCYFRLGEIAFEQEQAAESISRLEQARKLAPDHLETLYMLGRAHMAREDFETAIEWFAECESLDDSDGRAIVLAAECYRQLGRNEIDRRLKNSYFLSARETYQRAIGASGVSQASVYNNIGICTTHSHDNNRYLKALSSLERALSYDYELTETSERAQLYANVIKYDRLAASVARRRPSLQRIDDLVSRASSSRELFIEAACSYALAAKLTPDTDTQLRYLHASLKYCVRASELGITAADLKTIQSYNSELSDQKQWDDLQNQVVAERLPEFEGKCLDPLLSH